MVKRPEYGRCKIGVAGSRLAVEVEVALARCSRCPERRQSGPVIGPLWHFPSSPNRRQGGICATVSAWYVPPPIHRSASHFPSHATEYYTKIRRRAALSGRQTMQSTIIIVLVFKSVHISLVYTYLILYPNFSTNPTS